MFTFIILLLITSAWMANLISTVNRSWLGPILFVEIDREIISTVILLPSADSFKKGCCQLQAKVRARITG